MTNDIHLLADFGSTCTKIVAVDIATEKVFGRARAPTTVQSNILDGLKEALKRLAVGGVPIDTETIQKSKKLASSSAAGGLCILAVGLVPLEAAQGAGANVVGVFLLRA